MKYLLVAIVSLLLCGGPALADPAADIAGARAKLAATTSYRVTFDDESGTTTIDYAPPDRMRIRTPLAQTVIVGGSISMNTGSGWVAASVNRNIYLLIVEIQDASLLAVGPGDQATAAGSESVAGAAMDRYEIKTVDGGTTIARRTIWINPHSGLPYRVTRADGSTTLTATYSDFGANFRIEVPSTPAPGAGGGY
jgi:outer membrane lipoprotein-sorting protein